MTTTANAKQVAGDHYKTEYQHWDMLVDIGYTSEYYAGQVTKYLMRWRKKNGVRDVLKAQHFIEKMLELANGDIDFLRHAAMPDKAHEEFVLAKVPYLRKFFTVNEVPQPEQVICATVLFADRPEDLVDALECMVALLEEARQWEAEQQAPKDLELPVARKFKFEGYTGANPGETTHMAWVCKDCGQNLVLELHQPPKMFHQCSKGESDGSVQGQV